MRTNFLLRLFVPIAAVALLTPGCVVPATTAPAPVASAAVAPAAKPAPSVPLQDLDYSGDQSALIALDRDLNAAGTDLKKLAELETRLVALLRRPDGSIAARQAACQRLGAIFALGGPPGEAALTLFKTMLADDRESDIARLALETVAGEAIDALFVEALGKTTDRTRLGLLQSIGTRRTATAVPALEKLLKGTDAPTAAAAASALGQIGGPAALAALRTAPAATAAVVDAKLAVARTLPTAGAVALFTELQRDQSLAAPRRAAAFRGLLDLEPAAAATRIADALAADDWIAKEVAIESIAASSASGLISTLAAKLSSWSPATQAAVLSAFGRRADPAATPAIVAATKHADATVRAAAIDALGRVPGDSNLAGVLLALTTGANAADAKLARASLARLNGPGVSAAVLAGAEKSDPAQRAVFIDLIAARGLTEGLPLLRNSRRDPDAAVRAAAVGALSDLATFSDQALILDWAATATDSTEQSRAMRALVNLTLRNPDTATRALSIYQRLEKSAPADALRLLPVLSRLGGRDSADCAARLALGSDTALADAATAALARWLDGTAQPALATIAAKATVASARTAATQAVLRYFERNREPWTPEHSALVGQLLDANPDEATRKRLVPFLYRAADKSALALAEKLSAEPAVADAAKAAALCIAANLAGPPAVRVSAAGSAARNLIDGKVATQWRVPATNDQWVELDFRQPRPLHRLTLDQTDRLADFPEKYEVFVTDDLKAPGKPVASGAGQRTRTAIDLPAGTKGRYVILKHTGDRSDGTWSICELFVD